jgi:hypothetical protein
LLFSPHEVTVRTLFAKAYGELPAALLEKTFIVRIGTFTSSALHANHGRALTCRHSTLGPGIVVWHERA